ncbi:hypothetical protein BDQ12DRAFT_180030 [Crucibulum laeve]|uniref:Integral membrane protein n=1 Tax=Crucibulum laeve TaxID=68775 RepID=A0A5C3MHL5_9AGAR|nr:hypothetical protein BDQ12DRAFT_180030 [Crucibulum laeve]
MPSIRVRGPVYATLGDGPSNDEPRSLATIFTPATPVLSSVEPRPRPSMPSLRQEEDRLSPELTTQAHRRPRARTSASRIHAHCMLNTLRGSRAIATPETAYTAESLATPTPQQQFIHHDGIMTMEGAQADVVISSPGQPGIIESNLSLPRSHDDAHRFRELEPNEHHHDDIVEHLDVIDPRIGAVTNLTNAANSILIPPSSWYSRKPVIMLPSLPRHAHHADDKEASTQDFEDSLDRHVDDILKRPSKIRRTLQGVWSFLKTPMGIIAGIYGFLVVFWGAAIVIFLAKIINLHNSNTQGFWIEVSSQIENGLFTVTGIGLIPSRVLDTYRIFKIWYYKRRTIQLREIAGLPQLFDVDDLPDPMYDPNYVHVLTKEEQDDLHRQQVKFQYHQTWYRAHGTETHRAFPINMALLICFLNDGNSVFQIFLCATMWGLNRFDRPPWSTGLLIPASFMCGIAAGVLIWRGGERTKRVEEVRERLRAALDAEQTVDVTHTSELNPSLNSPILPSSLARNDKSDHDEKRIGMDRTGSVTGVDEQMVIPPSHALPTTQ